LLTLRGPVLDIGHNQVARKQLVHLLDGRDEFATVPRSKITRRVRREPVRLETQPARSQNFSSFGATVTGRS